MQVTVGTVHFLGSEPVPVSGIVLAESNEQLPAGFFWPPPRPRDALWRAWFPWHLHLYMQPHVGDPLRLTLDDRRTARGTVTATRLELTMAYLWVQCEDAGGPLQAPTHEAGA